MTSPCPNKKSPLNGPLIRAQKINLSINGVRIFRDLSFKVGYNEIVCFAGPTGKGKSSLLKMLQGYILPDSGLIEIAGKNLDAGNIKEIRAMMSYIPQNINLPVNDGTELLKMLRAEERTEITQNIMQSLDMEGNMLSRPFDEMSGGQKQRIIIAICLSLDRDIILLDEPTSALDDESTGNLVKVIKGLNRKTIISASHNPIWLRSSDKTILL